MSDPTLSPAELAIYEWQMWVRDLGVEGQRKLKNASVLVSRCGGLGGFKQRSRCRTFPIEQVCRSRTL